ncbi:DnaA ATPase domain-containing protein [Sulfurovum sp. NBC37-1]|uniref:DnaA ATPase domain-containing protein n=1 Tax=Sulfurovum sp. (strain NBC37-1) TaxID=387093 RepID=UPI00059FDFEA|nr:DnaA/Hda family protein [Sulfurovum sp. NBC37-1]
MGRKAIYVTVEDFANKYAMYLMSQTMNRFRNKYQRNDVLLLDNFDDISNMFETQKQLSKFIEFYNENHKNIVIAMSRHPVRTFSISDRLKNHLLRGLSCELKGMHRETIDKLIHKKCHELGLKLNDKMVHRISKYHKEIPKIEGILHKAYALSDLLGQKVDIALIKQLVKEFKNEEKKQLTSKKVKENRYILL